ncbi:MAG: glycoside hydrolase family 2 TIM barrel-domain containing protein [Clostridia bacterium]
MNIPRPEYPRPQLVRDQWMNLNGLWQFEIDSSMSGLDRKFYERDRLDSHILVPFCPESELSGVNHKDFMAAVWYRREFDLPAGWNNGHVLLHFGAVDYEATVWVNGKHAGMHKGGYSSFCFDISPLLKDKSNTLVVYARDDNRSGKQPSGKQSDRFHSYGCLYTRTTGIWQTVWLELVPATHIKSLKFFPDPENACLHIQADMTGAAGKFTAQASFNSEPVGEASCIVPGRKARLTLNLSEVHLWAPGDPNLYALELELGTGDRIKSYFGLRDIRLEDGKILLNGKPVFQRLVLDQGFYPDGIYTAPSDDALRNDIAISLGLGFNGARLHQKIFEPRFLYWADKMGYLIWEEHANWGLDISTAGAIAQFLPEWAEILERDFNHPAIVGWCPFNETWDRDGKRQEDAVLQNVCHFTRSYDPTRPVIDTSGNYHVDTDVFDIHCYEQDPVVFQGLFHGMKDASSVFNTFPDRQSYDGQPYFVSEYGGIKWEVGSTGGWGYGKGPATGEEFIDRYRRLTHTLLDHPMVCAFCYTQLTDVEQEANGLYTYDRKHKFDPEIFREINTRKARIEE